MTRAVQKQKPKNVPRGDTRRHWTLTDRDNREHTD